MEVGRERAFLAKVGCNQMLDLLYNAYILQLGIL